MPATINTGAMPIGAMLRIGTTYKVPPYQRDFSWTEDEFGRLWDDLEEGMRSDRQDYFLGSMVVNDTNPDSVIVIDGQQRLTSVSVLLCVLRDVARLRGDVALSEKIPSDFLGRYDYQSEEHLPRLELNRMNKGFYVEHIFTPTLRETVFALASAEHEEI